MKKIRTLLNERTPLYEKYADITVDVSTGSVKQITQNILKKLEETNNEKDLRNTRTKP